jgi:RNA polymerase sigma-70 factor (ECF subfamily)
MKKNKQAFANLLEENKGIIHKIALLYTRNQADKEDLYQDICLQLWKSFKSYREEAKFSTWLYRVALNTAISQVRKQKKLAIPAETYIQNIYTTTKDEGEEQLQLLFKAISYLNKIDRAIIFLWLDEKRYEEIADILGISKSNVSVKLVRIKQQLAEIIKGLER